MIATGPVAFDGVDGALLQHDFLLAGNAQARADCVLCDALRVRFSLGPRLARAV
jgi:hypothetical protein